MDERAEERFVDGAEGILAVEVAGGDDVGHLRELVAVGVEEFLHGFLRSHMVPLAVGLRGEVVEVADVACLFACELGVFGEVDIHCA